MTKRHNTSRRRSYGRRQHEVHERADRRNDHRADRASRLSHGMESATWESQTAEAPFGFVD